MKAKRTNRARPGSGDKDTMRPEYDFSKGVRGKHAAQYAEGTNVVVLDSDVAAEFPTAEEVNDTLRAVAELLRRRRRIRPTPRNPIEG